MSIQNRVADLATVVAFVTSPRLMALMTSVRPEQNPYHNAEHTSRVVALLRDMLDERDMLETEEGQLLLIAAAAHDWAHIGFRYVQLASLDDHDSSNEEVAACIVEAVLGQMLSEAQIEFVRTAILSTSFGQNEGFKFWGAEIPTEWARQYRAQTELQSLLGHADVMNCLYQSPEEFLLSGLFVNLENLDLRDMAFEAYLASQVGFLGFLQGVVLKGLPAELPTTRKLQRHAARAAAIVEESRVDRNHWLRTAFERVKSEPEAYRLGTLHAAA